MSKYKVNNDYLFNHKVEEDEAHFINLLDDSQDIYKITEPAIQVFKLISQDKSIEFISKEISKLYNEDLEVVKSDVEELVEDLVMKGILI